MGAPMMITFVIKLGKIFQAVKSRILLLRQILTGMLLICSAEACRKISVLAFRLGLSGVVHELSINPRRN